jgi:hypothetical protein
MLQRDLRPDMTDNGKVSAFDLPGFEFYRADKAPRPRVVREGRLKHLSSRHRLYESSLISSQYTHTQQLSTVQY